MAWGAILLSPCPFWIRFCQLNFYHKFQHFFWRWKLTSIGLIWYPTKVIEPHKKLLAEDEHYELCHLRFTFEELLNYLCVKMISEYFKYLLSLSNQEKIDCDMLSGFIFSSTFNTETLHKEVETNLPGLVDMILHNFADFIQMELKWNTYIAWNSKNWAISDT